MNIVIRNTVFVIAYSTLLACSADNNPAPPPLEDLEEYDQDESVNHGSEDLVENRQDEVGAESSTEIEESNESQKEDENLSLEDPIVLQQGVIYQRWDMVDVTLDEFAGIVNQQEPDLDSTLFQPATPGQIGNSYGTRLYTILTPKVSGSYTFYLAGDDRASMKLSKYQGEQLEFLLLPGWTNQNQWDKYPEQKSDAIELEEGQLYEIEVLHIEGNGGDHVSIGWQLNDDPISLIPGNVLGYEVESIEN